MRVCLAAQVFSHSVAAGLQTWVHTKESPSDALQTAAFVEQMDSLFDVLNSRKRKDSKPARCALSAGNITSLSEWVQTWSFIGARAQSAIKCHKGLLLHELLTDV